MAKTWRHGFTTPPTNAGYMATTFGRVPERLAQANGLSFDAARNAHMDACSAWCEIYDRHGRLLANETMTPAARLRVSAERNGERAEAAKDRIAQALVENADLGAAARKRVAAATAPPNSPGQAAIDAEVRAWLRGLNSDARLKAVQQARESGDTTVLRAVASAPAPLSGLAPDNHASYRQTYAELVAPEDAALEAAHSEAVELLVKAQQELDWHVGQLGLDQAIDDAEDNPAQPRHPDFPQSYVNTFPTQEAA